MTAESTTAIEVFCSYAHNDESLRNELDKHLSSLWRQKLISVWHDRKISVGTEWEQEIDNHLSSAQIILLLISPDFIASNYCYGIEMKRAMERHEAGEARVIPIILQPVDWQDMPFKKLQALPKNAKPVTLWHSRNQAFLDIAREIRRVIEELRSSPSNTSLASIKMASRNGNTTKGVSQRSQHLVDHYREDWGEDPPDYGQFYGRGAELAQLKQWIVDDRCRMVTLGGLGGMGKTTLGAQLAKQITHTFDYVFWRSLQKMAPPLREILRSCILFFSNQQQTSLPEDINGQIATLMECLRKHRCLLMLDNFDTVLQAGYPAGQYKEGYEEYGRLLQRIGEIDHQSCLLLTSREKPKEVAHFRRENISCSIIAAFWCGIRRRTRDSEGQRLVWIEQDMDSLGWSLFGQSTRAETGLCAYSRGVWG